jgi:hypothetical protein
LPLALASVAWACGVLATLKLDTKVAAPGDTVTATGKNYSSAQQFGDVEIRLQKRNGRLLATTPASASGRINDTFALPEDLDPGWYVVVATQYNTNTGTPKNGTPGRTSLRVQGTSNGGTVAAPWSSGGPPIGGGAGGQSLLPLLLAGLLSLSMLAGGLTLLGRRSRNVPGTQLGV